MFYIHTDGIHYKSYFHFSGSDKTKFYLGVYGFLSINQRIASKKLDYCGCTRLDKTQKVHLGLIISLLIFIY